MRREELAELIPPGGVFRTGQILAGRDSPADVRRQLDRWVKNGRILRLRRGVYMLGKPIGRAAAHPFVVANALKKASYVSLQSALAHYGMIPEYVPVTTSVTTRRPEEVGTPIGRFQFRHVVARLFFGFADTEISREEHTLLAAPEKALVDLLYLSPRSDDIEYLRELRLERPEGFDLDNLWRVVDRAASTKVERAVARLVKLWDST